MRDDFDDKNFNRYSYPVEFEGVPDDGEVELFVAGIPPTLTETGLWNLLSSEATILHVFLKPFKNIAFVTVRRKDAYKVISCFNNRKLADHYLTVKLAKPKRPSGPSTIGPLSGSDAKSASAAGGVEHGGKMDQSSGGRFVIELEIPTLGYPSAAKYVQVGQQLACAEVLNIISPSQFWIYHRYADSAEDQLKSLHDEMQKHYSRMALKKGFKQNSWSLYAARCSNGSGQWCRVQALSYDTESVTVLLLDYGTIEKVGLTSLHSLEGQFLSLPFHAVHCSLAHVEGTPRWSQEAADSMRLLVKNEKVLVKVCSMDGYLLSVELTLSSSSQSVGDFLVARNHARYVKGDIEAAQANRPRSVSSEDSVTDYPSVKDLCHTQLKVNERYDDVVVLHARNAADVTVCLKHDIMKLVTLLTELLSYEFSEVYVPHVGEIVAAQYEDSGCYRAEVLSVNNDTTAVVQFLDYGNTATINLKSVIQLEPRHIAFPVYGINVSFGSSDIDSKLLQECSKVNLKVLEQCGNQYVVSLADDDLAENPASQPTYSIVDVTQCCLEAGKTYKAWVTDAVDLEAFYVQVPQFDYFAISNQLRAIYGNRSGSYEPQQPGELIAVRLNEDQMWCRAVVKEIAGKDVQCQLIDFGTSVSKSNQYIQEIRRIDSRLLTPPIAAFKCSFYGVIGSRLDSWVDEYLKPMTGIYNMTIVEVKGDMHFVELVHVESAVDWKQKLIDDGFLVKARWKDLPSLNSAVEQVSEQLLPSLCDDEVRQIFNNGQMIVVVHANSPSDFYLQAGSKSARKKLESLQQSINSFCMQSSSCRVDTANSAGQIVGVLHDDGLWYRGEIQSQESDGKFEVHFVDIGITKTVESGDLRSLPYDLAFSLPRQAILCAVEHLVGTEPDGSWSPAAVERFQKFCASRDFTLKVIYKSDSGNSWMVDLLHAAGVTTKDMLLTQKLAVQRTDSSSSKSNKSISKRSAHVLPHRSAVEEVRVKPLPVVLSSNVENAWIKANDMVTVTSVHSPGKFFIYQQHEASAQVMQELNSHCKAQDQSYCPRQIGELVGVMQNSQWHRAEVLSLDTHTANVLLIDSGTGIDNVDFKDIRALMLHFATVLPRLAICCAIGGLIGTGKDGSYTEAATRWFTDNYLQVASVVIKVKDAGPSSPLLINLNNSKSSRNARQSLLYYGMGSKLESVSIASNSAASTLARSSPSVVQPSTIPKPHTESPVTTPRESAHVASTLTCSSPSRIQPFSISQPPTVSVVSTPRERQHAGSTPAQSRPSCMQPSSGPKPPTESPPRECAHFEEATVLQEFAAVSVAYVNSPVDFYVIPLDPSSLQQFLILTKKLAEFCITGASYRPCYVGEPVAAVFEGEWFRAEVVKLMPNNEVKVFFVDYGNMEVVEDEDLRSLTEEFVKWPKQVVHCGIDGICGTGSGYEFTDTATMWFVRICCESSVTLSSVRIADTKHLVNISVNDDDAKDLLIRAGFARSV